MNDQTPRIDKQGRKIRALREIIKRQNQELEEIKVHEDLILQIKSKFIDAYCSSRKFWKLKSRSALDFFNWLRDFFRIKKLYTTEEEDLIFPPKPEKKPKGEILPKEERKKILRKWRFKWREK